MKRLLSVDKMSGISLTTAFFFKAGNEKETHES